MKTGSSTSIRAVLMNLSNEEGLPFQQVVTRYLHERLLYRLSVSEYQSTFILKGSNLLYAVEGLHIRPTKDIDMLAKHISNDKEVVKDIFRNICSINYNDDCVTFDVSNITALDIAEEKKYNGIRLLINALFDTIKQRLQIDIGFGDVIFPAPLFLSYPTLLEGLNPPAIMAYSIETVISEKFEAMIYLGAFNSRMKDFYDIFMLLKNNEIDDNVLRGAVFYTFKQRNAVFDPDHPLFSEDFAINSKRIFQWKHFLKKIKAPDLDFPFVVKSILERLQPLYNELSKIRD